MKQLKRLFGRRDQSATEVKRDNIPEHIAIIMDGNGRWASSRGLPRVAGHRFGMKNVKDIAIAARDLGVKVLTLYAFSTENWKRPKEEVDYLMRLPQEFFPKEIEELMKNNIQIRMIGDANELPESTLCTVRQAIEQTRHNTGMILNFALNYGSRAEMIRVIRRMLKDAEAGLIKSDEINEELVCSYLDTAELPDPDLLIRTSGELRISNFMLWQIAYAEFWFTDVYWPDFTREHLNRAVRDYQNRKRRYGGLPQEE